MMRTRRCAGLVALMMLAVAALVLVGCSGGDGDGANTGSISGTVHYAATGDALGGVEVSVDGVRTTTNAAGQFTLSRVSPGQRTLSVQASADRNLVVAPGVPLTVTVEAGETMQLPAPIPMIDDQDNPPHPPS